MAVFPPTISAIQYLHKNRLKSKTAFVINSEHNRERLERIQRSCTKIVLAESEHPDRLAVLNMAMLPLCCLSFYLSFLGHIYYTFIIGSTHSMLRAGISLFWVSGQNN
mgnify:CR=1 FL=1